MKTPPVNVENRFSNRARQRKINRCARGEASTARLARSARNAALLVMFGTLALGGCQASDRIETGGETHFLKSCSPLEDDCGGGLSCVCGICTVTCDNDAVCSQFPGATCVNESTGRCGQPEPAKHCDAECRRDADCGGVSPFHVCVDGTCRTEAPAPVVPPPVDPTESQPDAAAEPASSSVSETATDDSTVIDTTSSSPTTSEPSESSDAPPPNNCGQSGMNPNNLLLIGDSFFAATHQTTAYLEGFARAAGVLAEGERYRDGSRMVGNSLAGGGIREQYLTALDDGPVQVVLMNGGGADAFMAPCDAPYDACAELLDAVAAAEALFAEMATNGVTDVVYAFYPDSELDEVRARVDFLRPQLESVCANATLACRWVDLRQTFDGFMDTYIAPDGSLPTAAGSQATARAIWAVMQEHCIAQ